MEDKEEESEREVKMKKKKIKHGIEEDLTAVSEEKERRKKKKRKKNDVEEEEEEMNMENTDKKRKEERKNDLLFDPSSEGKKKKKKKRKKNNEREEEEEEEERRRHKDKLEKVIKEGRTLEDKEEKVEQENEPVDREKKKKKKKLTPEQMEHFTPKRKKKKKRREERDDNYEISQEEEEEEESENRERGGGKVKENLPPSKHTFLQPFPVTERRRGGGRDNKTGREESYYRQKWRTREKGITNYEETLDDTDSDLGGKTLEEEEEEGRRRITAEGGGKEGRGEITGGGEKRRRKERTRGKRTNEETFNTDSDFGGKTLEEEEEEEGRGRITAGGGRGEITGGEKRRRKPAGISRLAYNGMVGWETDTTTDDFDFPDEHYHLPRHTLRERMRQARKNAKKLSQAPSSVIYSEGEEIEGCVSDPRYSEADDDTDWTPVDVPVEDRHSPGFHLQERHVPSLEEAMYTFPPDAGIPEEEVEEVREAENYWVMKDRVLDPAPFADEAKKYIDAKVDFLEDYFERLREGRLDPGERKETRPLDFDGPFLPTPHQLRFLDTLNIRITWPLSELHHHHLSTCTTPARNSHRWEGLGLYADTSRITLREEKIIARNWFAFQKEYQFHDLRPLVSVRTARLVREDGRLFVQHYHYLSPRNRVHFLLYLARDLPCRPLHQIERKIQKLLPFIRGERVLRGAQRVTGPVLARLRYVLEVFGADMVAAELLVGRSLRSYFSQCFNLHIMLRNVKLRIGPWREGEDQRLMRGLKEVMQVGDVQEAYWLRRVSWRSIFPYVRTRSTSYMHRRLIVLACQGGEKVDLARHRREMARFIQLLYSQRVSEFSGLDWEGLARESGATNPVRLVWSFRKLYFTNVPPQHRVSVPDGLRYMYKYLVPFYETYDTDTQEDSDGDQYPGRNTTLTSNTSNTSPSNPRDTGNLSTRTGNSIDDFDDVTNSGHFGALTDLESDLISDLDDLMDDLTPTTPAETFTLQGRPGESSTTSNRHSDLRKKKVAREDDLRISSKVKNAHTHDVTESRTTSTKKKVRDNDLTHSGKVAKNVTKKVGKKVTATETDLTSPKKAKKTNDPTRHRKVSQSDLSDPDATFPQDHSEDPGDLDRFQHDPTCPMYQDSDDLSDLTSDDDDDDDDDDEVTLGHVLGRNR